MLRLAVCRTLKQGTDEPAVFILVKWAEGDCARHPLPWRPGLETGHRSEECFRTYSAPRWRAVANQKLRFDATSRGCRTVQLGFRFAQRRGSRRARRGEGIQ